MGYLYLLLLGLLSDTIYYRFFGLDILNYTTFQDVLLSPVAVIAQTPWVIIMPLLSIGLFYWLRFRWSPTFHQKYREKNWYRTLNNVEKLDRKYANSESRTTMTFASMGMFLLFFLGMGIGKGQALSEKIARRDIASDYKVTFHDEEVVEAKLIGQNSQYIFYVTNEDKTIRIVPIVQNIKWLQKISPE